MQLILTFITFISCFTPFQLPQLPYKYNDLEPYIDAKTMELHHSRHFKAYTDKLNVALKSVDGYQDLTELLTDIAKDKYKSSNSITIRNNGGGYLNHKFYFETLTPTPSLSEKSNIYKRLQLTFGSFEEFKFQFTNKAMGVFGSGWCFLVYIPSTQKLEIVTTANQDIPQFVFGYTDLDPKVLIALDVWEHAYYLHYFNQRKSYIDAWWKVLDFEKIAQLYDDLLNKHDEL